MWMQKEKARNKKWPPGGGLKWKEVEEKPQKEEIVKRIIKEKKKTANEREMREVNRGK